MAHNVVQQANKSGPKRKSREKTVDPTRLNPKWKPRRVLVSDPLPPDKEFEPVTTSLEAKGFHRFVKPYQPPADVRERIEQVCEEVFGATSKQSWEETAITDGNSKFKFLTQCAKATGYDIHNSQLHKMRTAGDVLAFYETPVSTQSTYESMHLQDMPPNLHIQLDPVRFHPETDTKFNGVSAFPRTSTIVTNLKYRKLYKSHFEKNKFPERDRFF